MHGHWGKVATAATGTGSTITVSALAGAVPISQIRGVDIPFRYVIWDSTGAPVCSGRGSLNGTTLTRDSAETTWNGTSYVYAGSLATLPGGAQVVGLSALANDLLATIPGVQGSFGIKQVPGDGLAPGTSNPITLAANIPIITYLRWGCAARITALACQITTAAGTGSDKLRMFVVPVKSNGLPGPVIAQTSDVLPNAAGRVQQSLVGGDIECPSEWVGVGVVCSVAPGIAGFNNSIGNQSSPLGMVSGSMTDRYGYLNMSSIGSGWSSVPTTLTASSATALSANFPPMIHPVVL